MEYLSPVGHALLFGFDCGSARMARQSGKFRILILSFGVIGELVKWSSYS